MSGRKTLPPIEVPAEAYDALKQQADSENKTVSNTVRAALAEYLKRRGVNIDFSVGDWGGKRDSADE